MLTFAALLLTVPAIVDEVVTPDFQQVVFGEVTRGDLNSLKFDDGDAEMICRVWDPLYYWRVTVVRFGGTVASRGLSGIDCRVKLRQSNIGPGRLNVSFFDWHSNAFIYVGFCPVTPDFSEVRLLVTGNVDRFVRSTDGQLRMEADFRNTGPVGSTQRKCVEIEQLRWILH